VSAAPLVNLEALELAVHARQGRREGAEIRFTCPAHADKHPSARWHPAKQVWVCDACKSGGGARDLAGRLGLYEESPSVPPAAVYPYVNEQGQLLFEVLRSQRPGALKTFRQRKPDGGGGWVYKLGDTPRVLFRLPQVLRAAAEGQPVWVVEGEKDVLAAEQLGLVATTNPNGAGGWRPELHTAPLRGCRVYLVPDNDEPGRQHVEAVARSLAGVAAEVRLVDLPGLPPKGDLADFVAICESRGDGRRAIREELERLASEATVLHPPAARPLPVKRLSDVLPEQVSFLWCPFIPMRKLTILEGDPGGVSSTGICWLTTSPGPRALRKVVWGNGSVSTLLLRLNRLSARLSTVLAVARSCSAMTPT
jgi:putative DNA primase/helicase